MLRRAWIAWAAAATVLAGCSAGDYDGDFEKPAPAVPPTLTVQAGPAASTAPWTTPLTVSNSQTCAPVLQLTLTAGPTEDIRVDSIRFSFDTSLVPVGSVANLSAMSLFQDAEGNGFVSIGFDGLLATTNSPQNTVQFQSLNRILPAGQQQHWLLVYDLNGLDPGSLKYSATFEGASGVSATGVLTSLAADVTGGAVNGRVLVTEAKGSLHLLPGSGNPVAANIMGNETAYKMLHLRIDAGVTEDVTVTIARFTHTGTASETSGITAVRLVRDVNADGTFDGGDTTLGTQTYSGVTHKVTFSGLAETVAATQSIYWLLLYDFSGTTVPGLTFEAGVSVDTDVSGTGVTTAKSITPVGAPVRGGVMSVPLGRLAAAAGSAMPAGLAAAPPLRRSVIQVSLTTSGAEGINLSQIVFTNAGSGSTAQIQNVLLLRDSGATPGQYDPGPTNADPQLAQNLPIAANTITVAFSPAYNLIPNQTEDWILVFDWAASASGSYRVSMDPTSITAVGNASGQPVTASGSLAQGNTFTVTPAGPVPSGWYAILAGGGPGQRVYPTGVYDPGNTRALFFGGAAGTALYGTGTNLTHALSVGTVGTEAWTALTPGGTLPGVRMAHAACYDSTGQRMIVFGGYDNATPTAGVRQDVHALSCAGGGNGSWTQLSPTGTPPAARALCTAVYDPQGGRVLVFGGFDGTNPLGDVQVLTLGASPAWSAQTTGGAVVPSPRYGHAAGMDAASNQMVLFGGFDGTNHLNDTYLLSLSSWQWTQLSPGTPPAARRDAAFAFDGFNRRLYLFGGWDGTNARQDVHVFDMTNNAWSPLSPAGAPPSLRCGAAAAFDTGNNRLIVFGGGNSPTAPLMGVYQDAFEMR